MAWLLQKCEEEKERKGEEEELEKAREVMGLETEPPNEPSPAPTTNQGAKGIKDLTRQLEKSEYGLYVGFKYCVNAKFPEYQQMVI